MNNNNKTDRRSASLRESGEGGTDSDEDSLDNNRQDSGRTVKRIATWTEKRSSEKYQLMNGGQKEGDDLIDNVSI